MSILATWTGHHYLKKWRICYPPLIRKRWTGDILRKGVSTGAYIASFTEQLRAFISINEFFQQSPPLARLSINPLIDRHIAHSEVLEIGLVFSVVLILHVPNLLSFVIFKHNSEENDRETARKYYEPHKFWSRYALTSLWGTHVYINALQVRPNAQTCGARRIYGLLLNQSAYLSFIFKLF